MGFFFNRIGASSDTGPITRRQVLGAASGLLLATPLSTFPATRVAARTAGTLPAHDIEQIIGADGHLSSGVLGIDIARDDIEASLRGIRFLPGFQIQHELAFQPLDDGRAICNGDLALRASETQPALDAFLAADLVVQAFHQHWYDLHPQVWFVHFRGVGDPAGLARRVRSVIDHTATRLPQSPPVHPHTPLPADRIATLLGGEATVGENGIVTVDVSRIHGVRLGGIRVRPELDVSTSIQFQPLGGRRTVAVPDFAMTADETQPVLTVMRAAGWDVGCLYNQETGEDPQLYFSHMVKTGDPLTLAREIRAGLDRTAAVRA
jgi:uncharacterized protein DUF1259